MTEWVICWKQNGNIRCVEGFEHAQTAHEYMSNNLSHSVRTERDFKKALMEFYFWTPQWWREIRIRKNFDSNVEFMNNWSPERIRNGV